MKRFIHLTDLHFSHKDKTQIEIYFETRQTILDVLIKIKKLKPEPEFILISGDLTNTGDVKSYQALQDILNQISIPIYIALGNHDKRSSFNKVFKKINSKKPLFYSQILKGLNLIVLDTSVQGKISGEICDEQFKFLNKNLSQNKNLPSIIMMHHPPKFNKNSPYWISLDEKSTSKLTSELVNKDILAIICGHIHLNQTNFWHGIPVIISNGLYSTIDLSNKDEMKIIEGKSFNICHIRDNGIGVTVVPIKPKAKVFKSLNLEKFKNLNFKKF